MVNHKNLSVLVSHYDKIIVLLRFDGLVIVPVRSFNIF